MGLIHKDMDPVIVMGSSENYIGVRCYIDEILIAQTASRDRK